MIQCFRPTADFRPFGVLGTVRCLPVATTGARSILCVLLLGLCAACNGTTEASKTCQLPPPVDPESLDPGAMFGTTKNALIFEFASGEVASEVVSLTIEAIADSPRVLTAFRPFILEPLGAYVIASSASAEEFEKNRCVVLDVIPQMAAVKSVWLSGPVQGEPA